MKRDFLQILSSHDDNNMKTRQNIYPQRVPDYSLPIQNQGLSATRQKFTVPDTSLATTTIGCLSGLLAASTNRTISGPLSEPSTEK
jgi:hypothetical protein